MSTRGTGTLMWLLLPIKAFDSAKSRLSNLLTTSERSELAQAMAADVLSTVAHHPAFSRVVVCSGDQRAQTLADAYNADFLDDLPSENTGLDQSVHHAVGRLLADGVTELAVIHCDLPLLTRTEIDHFVNIHQRGEGRSMTITPVRRRLGTNLLAWRPLAGFSTQYGEDSFRRHCDLAHRLALHVNFCPSPGGALDIDTLDDLQAFLLDPRRDLGLLTRRCLARHGLIDRILSARATHEFARVPGTLTPELTKSS